MPINVKTIYTKDRMLKFNNYVVASKKLFWSAMSILTFIIAVEYILLVTLGTAEKYSSLLFYMLFLCIYSMYTSSYSYLLALVLFLGH